MRRRWLVWLAVWAWAVSAASVMSVAVAAAGAGKQTCMVAMSDGVTLATDVYLPRGAGPWPVILARTPYNKDRQGGAAYVRAGCAFVCQDMRGRFASQGENLPFMGCGWGEHRDGAETAAWIRKQPWCNGKIGTVGGSAGGITQNLLAGAAPEGLTAQYIVVAAASLYHHAAYVGGALRKSQIEGWLKSNRFDEKALAMYAEHPAYDEFWQQFDIGRKLPEINAPAIHVGGWFDTFSAGTVAAFVGRQHQGGPAAKGRQKLVMGPWPHGVGAAKVGELTFPNSSLPAKYSAAPWFAHHLLGQANGVDKLPAVAYYVMGDTSDPQAPGNEWRYADDWPVPATATAFHMAADGTLSAAVPAAAAPPGKDAVEYTFDPADPCPTVGGCNLNLPSGPMNQNRIENRKDVVAFTTAPLESPLEVTGQARARLHVACSATDTDLSVRLCDVYPNGKSYLMAEGMLRLRYRGGLDKPRPLTPGEAVQAEVELWPTSIAFNKGHRIRVTITGSNYPRFDVNPGTGEAWRPGCKEVKQTVRLFCGGGRPSAVVLPVVAPPPKP